MSDLASLRLARPMPLTPQQQAYSDRLYREYCLRPAHASRLTNRLLGALRAAANRVARHGNPPNRQARLAYRRWKKQRSRNAAIALYGDPLSPHPSKGK